jgi:hypothetical protein
VNSDLRNALDVLTRMHGDNRRITRRLTFCAVLLLTSALLLALNLIPLVEKLLKSFWGEA